MIDLQNIDPENAWFVSMTGADGEPVDVILDEIAYPSFGDTGITLFATYEDGEDTIDEPVVFIEHGAHSIMARLDYLLENVTLLENAILVP